MEFQPLFHAIASAWAIKYLFRKKKSHSVFFIIDCVLLECCSHKTKKRVNYCLAYSTGTILLIWIRNWGRERWGAGINPDCFFKNGRKMSKAWGWTGSCFPQGLLWSCSQSDNLTWTGSLGIYIHVQDSQVYKFQETVVKEGQENIPGEALDDRTKWSVKEAVLADTILVRNMEGSKKSRVSALRAESQRHWQMWDTHLQHSFFLNLQHSVFFPVLSWQQDTILTVLQKLSRFWKAGPN